MTPLRPSRSVITTLATNISVHVSVHRLEFSARTFRSTFAGFRSTPGPRPKFGPHLKFRSTSGSMFRSHSLPIAPFYLEFECFSITPNCSEDLGAHSEDDKVFDPPNQFSVQESTLKLGRKYLRSISAFLVPPARFRSHSLELLNHSTSCLEQQDLPTLSISTPQPWIQQIPSPV